MTEPNKIRVMADTARETGVRLNAELQATNDPEARKALRLRIKSVRFLERWCRSRAGYR